MILIVLDSKDSSIITLILQKFADQILNGTIRF